MKADMQGMNRRGFLMASGTAAAASGLPAAGREPFRGVFTIPSTPFQKNGEIDIPSFRNMIDFCIACGAHGLVFPVNASEWTALSDDERLKLSQVLVEQNAKRLPVVIGVTASTEENAGRFAAHARTIGADAVIAMPPRGAGDPPAGVILNYYRRISKAARLPVFVQNHDAPAGTNMPAELVIQLCREIEFVKYVKEETTPTTFKMSAILKGGVAQGVFGGAGGRYLIEEHRRGCAGQMPGCHVTDVVVALWNALEKGDEARALHIYKEMAPLFFFETQLNGSYKEVLYRRGVIACPLKRNGAMPMDDIASRYLDQILKNLEPLMTWKTS